MAELDLLIRGGSVVDGTGAPARTADVAIRDGVVSEIARVDAGADRVIDADGLLVTPGFVDIHTHYDAQLHWDPTASPASWHGVTTLLTGNCGFTLAPAKPEDLEWLLLMLSRVEGMSAEALAAGVTFTGGSLGDFLAGLEDRVGVNVAANVGHCAVRRWVMGDDASERTATPDEITAMQELVRAAMRDGAVGFTSSQLELHVAHDGRGVPSNHADPDELVALASVLGEFGRGSIEFIPRSFLTGYDDADRALVLAMARASGRPVHLNTLTAMPHVPDGWKRSLEFAETAAAAGIEIHPMFAANRQGAHFALGSTFLFDEMATFREALTSPSPRREELLRDPAVRDRMRAELADPRGRSIMLVWEVVKVEMVKRPEHEGLVGRTVRELADELGADPLDTFLDLSLADDLEMQFVLAAPPTKARHDAVATMMRSPVMMAGSSDGGAHLLSFCGADYPTRLLTEWVPGVLTLEQAVARLSSIPARAVGLTDRGVLREGAPADVNVIDPTRLRSAEAPRLVRDFPADAARFVVDGEGFRATIVNGEVLHDGGTWTGARPGRILRGGA
ncbi:MAG: amidohydrolase family protein [Acidimicrobiia bacterium]|jgi:N-acyl-D-aspartate/D-glutamate deacylase